jgi:hypothetical protein
LDCSERNISGPKSGRLRRRQQRERHKSEREGNVPERESVHNEVPGDRKSGRPNKTGSWRNAPTVDRPAFKVCELKLKSSTVVQPMLQMHSHLP